MDPFAVIVMVGVGTVLAFLLLLGKYYPGSGAEQMGLRSAQEIRESREALEAQDLDQMLDAHNARRRARGETAVSAGDLHRRVREDAADQQRRRDEHRAAEEKSQEEDLADRELEQMLELSNARRRKRGLPERTRDELREEFGGGPST